MRTAKAVLLSGALVAASGSVVLAQSGPALVTRDVNLRSQPTTNSYSLGILPGGSTIQAGPCGGGWCQAFVGGQTGFVSQQYLDFGGPGPRIYAAPPPPPPPVIYGPPPPVYVPAPVYVRPRPWWW
jgi:uncharacterized protein YraI